MMKFRSLLVVFVLFWACLACSAARPYITTLEGQHLYGQDLKGRWLILHYWASWCDICMGEMSDLQQFYQKMPQNKAQLFLVNYDGLSSIKIKQLLARQGVHIPSLVDNPGRLFGISSANALPMNIIVNPEGKVVDVTYGPTETAGLAKLID